MTAPDFYGMRWVLSDRADPAALPLADAHYSRQKPGTPQFVAPGRCLVLLAPDRANPTALWVTSWPLAQFTRHAWAGAWMNTFFRNEGAGLSSELIREAIAATRARYGEPPDLGMVTFIDRQRVRHKRDPGRCYRKAGFAPCGETASGLLALQLLPADMPPCCAARHTQSLLLL